MCVDYRKLNAVTKRPIYYIPEAKQLFDCLHESRYFSSLDLSMGYHQVEMEDRDILKTAFTTRTGQYAFRRMPFGLCGAPQSFQRVMASILREKIGNIALYISMTSSYLGKPWKNIIHGYAVC